MSLNANLANEERIPQQALGRDSRNTVSGRTLSVSMLLFVLAVALASWLSGYGAEARVDEGVPAVDSAAGQPLAISSGGGGMNTPK